MKPSEPVQRRKILFVLPALVAGGAERVLIELMNGLDRHRFAPEFFCVSDEGPLKPLISADIPFIALGERTGVFRALPPLYAYLKKSKPDVIVSTMAHMNFALLLLRPLFPHTRFIVRESITPSYILNRRPRTAPLIRQAYRILYPKADLVLSPAQIVIDEFPALLNLKALPHQLLYNPVDMVRTRGDGRAALDALPSGTVKFVAAGRLHPQKGFDRLLTHLDRMPKDHPWHLTILGEGLERPALEAVVKTHNLEKQVTLPGLNDCPWPVYAAADAFLLPSRFEGLPNVALEALACGTPVIAMKEAGGIGEIAALSNNAVTLCDTMDDFISAMAKVRAANTTTYRPSLLPAAFERTAIMEKFMQALEA
jgi:glycosyltransferase involved in cell wall biosynthesis